MKAFHIAIVALLLNAGCDWWQGKAKWKAGEPYTYYAHGDKVYIINEERRDIYFLDASGREVVESGKKAFNGARGYPAVHRNIPKEANPFDWKPDRRDAMNAATAFLNEQGTLFYLKQADGLSAEALEHEISRIADYYCSSYNERLAGLEKPVAYDTGELSHKSIQASRPTK